jgi:predicted regulator of Ras-like GTPase activity (Roadblock/LC7/MglB family)
LERIKILSNEEKSPQDIFGPQKRGYSTTKVLNDILKELNELEWVVSCAVIRRDGILMASSMSVPLSTETKRACAIMGATIVGAAKNITTKCRMGFPKRIIIQSKEGDVIITEAGNKALLVIMTSIRYNPTLMLEDFNRAAQRIDEVL